MQRSRFVGCLWISLISLNLVLNFWKPASWQAGSVIVSAVAMIEPLGIKSPQGLADVPIAIVFLWSGAMIAIVRDHKLWLMAAGILASIACLAFVAEFDMKKVEFGNLLNPVIAVSISLCWLTVSYGLVAFPLSAQRSRQSAELR